MYIRLIGLIALIGAIYGISLLPEHFRKQGDERTTSLWEKKLDAAVLVEETRVNKLHAKKELEYEKRINKLKEDYSKDVVTIRNEYAASKLLFNRSKICANQDTGTSKGEDPSRVHEASTTGELFPEPYATNIKQLMLEADLIVSSCKGLQEAVKKSDHMIVVDTVEAVKEKEQ